MQRRELGPDRTCDVLAVGRHVYVSASARHGRGVFAGRHIEPGDVIESCPVLVVGPEHVEAIESTGLQGFAFEWDDGLAFALGFGSLYNHSWTPNARYDHDYDRQLVVYHAIRPIEPGEEITINYTGEPDGRADLWFNPVET